MAKTKQRQPEKTGRRAVTYARVSLQSQAEEDKTVIVRAGSATWKPTGRGPWAGP